MKLRASLGLFAVLCVCAVDSRADRSVYVLQFPPDQDVSLLLYRTGVLEHIDATADVKHKFKKARNRTTTVEISVHNLPAPSDVKPELKLWVAWAVGPKGEFTRLGLIAGKELKVETELQSFGIVISAEPDPPGDQPKGVFVLESEFPVKKNSFFGMTKVVYTHNQ